MRPHRRHCALWLALTVLAAAPLRSQSVEPSQPRQTIGIAAHVTEASQRFGIPEAWIYAVIRVESSGRIGAVSSAGAMGLMQLMPGTWARQRARFRLGSDPFDPRDNILAGTSYLREMYDLYGPSGFLAAYNAGPGRYEEWRDKGRPLPLETRAYVARIAPKLQTGGAPNAFTATVPERPARPSWTEAALFAQRANDAPREPSAAEKDAWAGTATVAPAPSTGLFAPVSGRSSP